MAFPTGAPTTAFQSEYQRRFQRSRANTRTTGRASRRWAAQRRGRRATAAQARRRRAGHGVNRRFRAEPTEVIQEQRAQLTRARLRPPLVMRRAAAIRIGGLGGAFVRLARW